MAASHCKSCGQPIEWAKTAKGHRIPLDPDPVSPVVQGALVLAETESSVAGVTVWAYGLSDLAERMAEKFDVEFEDARAWIVADHQARLSHFATCPDADRHRRGRRPANS